MKEIDYSKLDPGVIPMVRYFNEHGLPTRMSCEGHGILNMSLFWIEFDKSVTENDIIKFMMDRGDNPRTIGCTFCSNGRFGKRIFVMNGKPYHYWTYVASTKWAAESDLINWKKLDTMKEENQDGN